MNLQNVMFRALREGRYEWVHFCHVPQELKRKFMNITRKLKKSTTVYIRKWAKEDFGVESIETWEQLEELKMRIKNSYRKRYPEIFLDNEVDRQGWIRVWTTKHIEREIEEYDKDSK
jgi:phenylacetate-coenzyme A ligase PaaK-like adenylate-forming protein